MSFTGRPSRPPLALISSSQIWAPSSACWPAPASEPVCAMLKPILIGLPLLCAKVGVLARTGEISAAPTPALTWRRVMRWVMVFLPNSLGLCRRDARAGQECGSTLSKFRNYLRTRLISIIHELVRPPPCERCRETDLDLLWNCFPPKASVVAFDFTEMGTFRPQLLTNVHQFTGRV